MAVDFKNSETMKNLMRAFAGESQARNRYTFAKEQAKQENLYDRTYHSCYFNCNSDCDGNMVYADSLNSSS